MAKVVEEIVVLRFSKLVKNEQDADVTVTPEVTSALEQVAQELVGDSVIVEIERA